jgi:hypothetical protein
VDTFGQSGAAGRGCERERYRDSGPSRPHLSEAFEPGNSVLLSPLLR